MPPLSPSNPVSTFLQTHFHPTLDFLSSLSPWSDFPRLPWSLRWRVLAFQPVVLLVSLITGAPYFLRRKPYTQIWIPTRAGFVRALVFRPPPATNDDQPPLGQGQAPHLRPVHLDLHGGGWVGGSPEHGVRFCALVAERTGAVVVSAHYRIAPRHAFPAAVNDVDDVVSWLLEHGEAELGVDPALLTAGGSSAGAATALAACVNANA